MSRKLKVDEVVDRASEVLIEILGDPEWFSALFVEAVMTGRSGLSWRHTLRGLITRDDWEEDVKEAKGSASAELKSVEGAFHVPDESWEFPFLATADEVAIPDSVSVEQESALRQRLRELAGAA